MLLIMLCIVMGAGIAIAMLLIGLWNREWLMVAAALMVVLVLIGAYYVFGIDVFYQSVDAQVYAAKEIGSTSDAIKLIGEEKCIDRLLGTICRKYRQDFVDIGAITIVATIPADLEKPDTYADEDPEVVTLIIREAEGDQILSCPTGLPFELKRYLAECVDKHYQLQDYSGALLADEEQPCQGENCQYWRYFVYLLQEQPSVGCGTLVYGPGFVEVVKFAGADDPICESRLTG